MSKILSFPNEDARMDQASQWVAKLDRGLDADEQHEFAKWVSEDAKNRDVLVKMLKLWDKMDVLNQLSDLFPHTPSEGKSSFVKPMAIAASFAVLSVLTWLLWSPSQTADVPVAQVQEVMSNDRFSTAKGEQARFTLTDGSELVLNTDSRVEVTFTNRHRLIELTQGEVHVTVAHNSEKPLSVYAGDNIIQAVGTAFNVELQQDGVELIVTDGKVLVADKQRQHEQPLTLQKVRLDSSSMAIAKGEKISLGKETPQAVAMDRLDMQADLSWQDGNLIFRGESLEQAMAEVSRYSDVQFEFSDAELRSIQVAGLFKTDDVDGLLEALQENFDVAHQRIGLNRIQLMTAKGSH